MPKPSRTIHKGLEDIPAISIEKLSITLGTQRILEDISFSVAAGTIVAIIGPNGSGKTTLMRAILGLLAFESGRILINGKQISEARKEIGYVPQRFSFDREFPITVQEFMNLARHCRSPKASIRQRIEEVGLTPMILHKRIGHLSGGQLQRVLVAQAILNDPSILFLDEPSTGIDTVGEAALYDVIEHLNHEHKTTVLMVSHDISMVDKLVDQVVCLNKRLLCIGSPKHALTEKHLSELYHTRAAPFHHTHEHHEH